MDLPVFYHCFTIDLPLIYHVLPILWPIFRGQLRVTEPKSFDQATRAPLASEPTSRFQCGIVGQWSELTWSNGRVNHQKRGWLDQWRMDWVDTWILLREIYGHITKSGPFWDLCLTICPVHNPRLPNRNSDGPPVHHGPPIPKRGLTIATFLAPLDPLHILPAFVGTVAQKGHGGSGHSMVAGGVTDDSVYVECEAPVMWTLVYI